MTKLTGNTSKWSVIQGDWKKALMEILETEDVAPMLMMGFVQKDGGLQPLIALSNTIPDSDAFYNELYDLLDKRLHFKKVYEMTKTERKKKND